MKQLEAGLGPYVRSHASEFPAIVVFPQVPENGEWMGANVVWPWPRWTPPRANSTATAPHLSDRPVDGRLWHLGNGAEGAERFAALVPICGAVLPPNDERALYVTEVAGEADPYAAIASRCATFRCGFSMARRTTRCRPTTTAASSPPSGRPVRCDVQYTEFPDASHNAWDPTYAQTPELWPWLFAQRRRPLRQRELMV